MLNTFFNQFSKKSWTKFFAFLAVLATTLFSSCKEEDPLPPLTIAGLLADSSLVNIDTTLEMTANIPVTWQLVGNNSGTLTPSGIDNKIASYRTPRTAGVYTLRVLNQADTTEKIIRTFIVTPRAAIFNALQRGGHVLSFRHAVATTSFDQTSFALSTNWWKSCDPAFARQLTLPVGRVQSENTGKALKLLKVPVGRVISSEFCRCVQTAQFMNLGLNIETSQFLTFFAYDEANRYANTLRLIREQTINNRNTIFVTHVGFSNIPAGVNQVLATLIEGDAAVFRLNPNGADATFVTVIRSGDFTGLIR
jgi:phosphohistidine phosphatase SixA